MKSYSVLVSTEAFKDLQESRDFYALQEHWLADYFSDSIITDIESLHLFAGIHLKIFGFYRMLSKRFPLAIYYSIESVTVTVIAILDMRKNPVRIKHRLKS